MRTILSKVTVVLVAVFLIASVFSSRASAATDGNIFFVYPVRNQSGGIDYVKGASLDGFDMSLSSALNAAFGAVTTRATDVVRSEDSKVIKPKRTNSNVLEGISISADVPEYSLGKVRAMKLDTTIDVGKLVQDVKKGRVTRDDALTKIRAAVVSAVETVRLVARHYAKAKMVVNVKGLEGFGEGAIPAKTTYNLKKSNARIDSFRQLTRLPTAQQPTALGSVSFFYAVENPQTGGVKHYLPGRAQSTDAVPLKAALNASLSAVTTRAFSISRYNKEGKTVRVPTANVNMLKGVAKLDHLDLLTVGDSAGVQATIDVSKITRAAKREAEKYNIDAPYEAAATTIRAAVVSVIKTAERHTRDFKRASIKINVKGLEGFKWGGSTPVPMNPRNAYNLKALSFDRRVKSFISKSIKR